MAYCRMKLLKIETFLPQRFNPEVKMTKNQDRNSETCLIFNGSVKLFFGFLNEKAAQNTNKICG